MSLFSKFAVNSNYSLVYIYLWLLYFTHLLQSDAATLCDHQLQSPMTTKHDGTTYMYIQRTLCSSVVYDQSSMISEVSTIRTTISQYSEVGSGMS